MVHSFELKFNMHITGHRRTNSLDFGERRKYSFLQEYKKNVMPYSLWSEIITRIVVSKKRFRLRSNLICSV